MRLDHRHSRSVKETRLARIGYYDLVKALGELSSEKVKVSVVHNGVGAITESDVMLASASHAIVIG